MGYIITRKKVKKRMVLLSLDEVDRVKRLNNISTVSGLEVKTGVSRKTWGTALKSRKPTMTVIEALVKLGARPSKILVAEESFRTLTAA